MWMISARIGHRYFSWPLLTRRDTDLFLKFHVIFLVHNESEVKKRQWTRTDAESWVIHQWWNLWRCIFPVVSMICLLLQCLKNSIGCFCGSVLCRKWNRKHTLLFITVAVFGNRLAYRQVETVLRQWQTVFWSLDFPAQLSVKQSSVS